MAPGVGTCKFKVGTYSRLGAYFKTFLVFMVGSGGLAQIQGWHLFMVGRYQLFWLSRWAHGVSVYSRRALINFFRFSGWHRGLALLNSRWALIQCWVLINFFGFQGGHWGLAYIQGGHVFEFGCLLHITVLAFRVGTGGRHLFNMGTYSRLGAY